MMAGLHFCGGLLLLLLQPVISNHDIPQLDNVVTDSRDIDVNKVLRQALHEVKEAYKVNATGCQCLKYDCGCCVDVNIPEIELDDKLCVNISYLPNDYGISLTFSINDKVYINETISARNPPPICFAIPDLKKLASACITFYDLDISDNVFRGCVKIEFELVHHEIIHTKLGCFKIPFTRQNETPVHKIGIN